DGIEAGLADRMNLLAGGPRADDRHRSLRSALDWSYALLDEADRAVLRRISVFAAPFTATAAQAMLAGWPPAADGAIGAALARLAAQSLLVTVADADGTRHRSRDAGRSRARLAVGFRSAGRRAARRAALGGGPRRAAARGVPAGDRAGRADLRPRAAGRVPAALRAGRGI